MDCSDVSSSKFRRSALSANLHSEDKPDKAGASGFPLLSRHSFPCQSFHASSAHVALQKATRPHLVQGKALEVTCAG